MYSKYKYHPKILVYLNNKRNEYLEHLELNKKSKLKVFGLHNNSFSSEDISRDLDIDISKIKETLTDLYDLGFIDCNDFRYSSKENTITYIESNHFENKRNSYLKNDIVRDIKDILIIAVAISTLIFPFILPKIECNTYEKDLQEQQLEVESIKLEQTKIQANQTLILNDFSKKKDSLQ
tara:strand:- start:3894 stop:4430 length:537 start_codon:yes stop_codon:yes gene_type:complete